MSRPVTSSTFHYPAPWQGVVWMEAPRRTSGAIKAAAEALRLAYWTFVAGGVLSAVIGVAAQAGA